ncbi:internal scaffolding protein [Blackfly microvirus SF02]|uniref:Internal scaffolding protein n=1 Tax=Blackfly microvirus SF02 TaxID=2576452 RepID=A0A4P8PKF9_9VIRU|nr:internal scaffolding protein [Blackfly microvirus SF02]
MKKLNKETGEITDEVTHQVIAMAPPFWKTPYNHDRDHESLSSGLACLDPSKTQQQFAEEADINNILRKFMQTGDIALTGTPTYQDLEKEFDLQESIVTRAEVEKAWNELPANVRNILKDPKTLVDYIDYVAKTGDTDSLEDLGLMPKKEPPKTPEKPPETKAGPIPPPPVAPEPKGEKGPS